MGSRAVPGSSPRFAEVAVPVPIRHAFTYRVPAEMVAEVAPGVRVAVPFARRKLSGFVLSVGDDAPKGQARLKNVAGVLDSEPLFSSELVDFLYRAADYYMHPVGEVLRAAAPALPSEAVGRLRAEGFLERGEQLPGLRVAVRRQIWVRAIDPTEGDPPRLGTRQQAVLRFVAQREEVSLDELRRELSDCRESVQRLAKRGLVELEKREVSADPFFEKPVEASAPPTLNAAQTQATEALLAAIQSLRPAGESEPAAHAPAFLLHGVTGSGKTEVYLRAIAEAQRFGRGALLLVPEIALTPQLVARFRSRFGDELAVLHSGLRPRERTAAWRALRTGAVRVAIGARSALFAPVPELGVLIVDEEHDPSFKQEEGFRYHARDMALMRARCAGAICVLGSATPSLETRYLAEQGRLVHLTLPERATAQPLPQVETVDLARYRTNPSGHPLISTPLHRALEECLRDGEQAILFLNRRGFAPSRRCVSCGRVDTCPACSVTLTEHRRAGWMRCHYCDFRAPTGRPCECGSSEFLRIGAGTEHVEEALRETFEGARVERLDRDVGGDAEAILDRFRQRAIDILVGTQMVTKGHDLPGVTVVGVLLADQSLMFPDFRGAERTFQLLSQVAGRAGRGARPGRVIFQTYQPEHPAVRAALRHDYEGFYRAEIQARRALGYPPFSRLVAIRVDAGDDRRAVEVSRSLAAVAASHPAVQAGAVRVLGPAPAPIQRLRGRYRHRLLFQSSERRLLRGVTQRIIAQLDRGTGPARVTVDVDPVSML